MEDATFTTSVRNIPVGCKVWPVKGSKPTKLWCGSAVAMTRTFTATKFSRIPDNKKFTRFLELNQAGKQLYMIALFPTPKPDLSSAAPESYGAQFIYGFVVDLNRTDPTPF